MEVEFKKINIDLIFDNGNSFTEFDYESYDKLKNNIKKNGQLKNIVVIKVKKGYEILDGSVVFKILNELKYKEILCCVCKDVKNKDLLSLELNIKFKDDYVKLSKKIKNILEEEEEQKVSLTTRFKKEELRLYSKLLNFDFKKYNINMYNELYLENNDEYF